MVLRNFEDRLERIVEGVFARAFKTGLQPVEIGRRLVKSVDAGRQLDANGLLVAPNRFEVHLAGDDLARFVSIEQSLVAELRAMVRDHAGAEGLRFRGPVRISLLEDPSSRTGMFSVDASFDDSVDPSQPLARVELPDGRSIDLGNEVASIGRLPKSTVVLDDPNASRHHAELRPTGDTFELVDLGSTNGSSVNGERIERRLLADGDELTFGTVDLRFLLA